MKVEDYLDSTYLKTAGQALISEDQNKKIVESLVNEAIKHGFKLVMIRPMYISLANQLIKKSKSNVLVGTVIDFPFGDSSTEEKIIQAKEVIELGVDDIDYVADYNIYKQKRFEKFDKDILEGTRIGYENKKTVKWIIETGALSKEEIKGITKRISKIVSDNFPYFCESVFVKTSTGYYGGFGATVKDVKLMNSVSGKLPIKASGGVSNFSEFRQMIEAGATRVGTSNALKIFKMEQK
tara:strand:+ start:1636 stop:2349 length:714 start_codon:yes stop_codon:yes gene_type:complete